MDGETTNSFLVRRRKELGLSQDYMAEQLGISVTSYRKIESGRTQLVNRRIYDIARILDTTPEKIIFGYSSAETGNGILKEEYDKTIEHLNDRNRSLQERISILEDLVKAKDEIISMLKGQK